MGAVGVTLIVGALLIAYEALKLFRGAGTAQAAAAPSGATATTSAGGAGGTGAAAPAGGNAPVGSLSGGPVTASSVVGQQGALGSPANPQAFVQAFGPDALKAEQLYGIPAQTLLAITSSESNYGAAPTFFGIICAGYPTCQSYTSGGSDSTGAPVSFRVYQSYWQGIQDFVQLVQQHYPQAWVVRSNPTAFLQALQAGGYGPADWPGIVGSRIATLNQLLRGQ